MTNFLRNPSFEDGWRDEGNCQLPTEWNFWFADASVPNPIDAAKWSRFVKPEMRVLTVGPGQLPEADRGFILDGEYTLKSFKGNGAWYMQMTQTLSLEPALYQFSVNVFGDLVKDYAGKKKVWANDPEGRDGLLCFMLDDHCYDWMSITPGEWNGFTFEFAGDGDMALGVGVMCPFALKNSGIFADAWELVKVSPGGVYYANTNVLILPLDCSREHAHALVNVMYDEL